MFSYRRSCICSQNRIVGQAPLPFLEPSPTNRMSWYGKCQTHPVKRRREHEQREVCRWSVREEAVTRRHRLLSAGVPALWRPALQTACKYCWSVGSHWGGHSWWRYSYLQRMMHVRHRLHLRIWRKRSWRSGELPLCNQYPLKWVIHCLPRSSHTRCTRGQRLLYWRTSALSYAISPFLTNLGWIKFFIY